MTIAVRAASTDDRPATLALAHRLTEGVSSWRDPAGVAEAVQGWVEGSVTRPADDDHACFVAEQDDRVIGFISVQRSRHWSGAEEAYIGELIVAESAEDRGVGRALVDSATAWGRARQLSRITLETGAANTAARAFYKRLDFEDDEIRLSRRL